MSDETTPTPDKNRRNKRIIKGVSLLLLLLLIGWLALKSWRMADAGLSLLVQEDRLRQVAADGMSRADPDELEEIALQIRADIHTLRNESRVFRPIMPYLGWLPAVGPTIVVAPALLDMAAGGTDAAAYAIRSLKPALHLMKNEAGQDEPLSASVIQIVAEARPDLAAAEQSLAQVKAAREAIGDITALPGEIRQLIEMADAWLPQAESGLKLALVAPEMMGLDGPRRYLVIAQNEDELRATGGFISGAGVIGLENGRIQSLHFTDAYNIDNWQEKPYDIPPEPLEQFMGLGLLLFRDANFWPDFPTSAEKLMDLYSYGQDEPPLDGAIAIDQAFMTLLVDALGEVHIPEDDLTLTRSNIVATLREAWGGQEGQAVGEWVTTRKDFLGPFAAAIRNRLENDAASLDYGRLATNMNRALQTRHLQIYTRNPAEDAVLTELGWNGRLAPQPDSDFLAIIESNAGFTKSNLYVERAADYQVAITAQGDALAELLITYTHTRPSNGQECIHYNLDVYSEMPDYLMLAENCYWNYLRLYVPLGSELLSSTWHTIPGEAHRFGETWEGEAQVVVETAVATTFANYLLLPMGQSMESAYSYQLPAVVQPAEDGESLYQLHVFSQAGSRGYPLRVVITLPPGAQLTQASPMPTAVFGSTVQFEVFIDRNSVISVYHQ
jgi:hypothetical protein